MDSATTVREGDQDGESGGAEVFFVEDLGSSDDELEIKLGDRKRSAGRLCRASSPPLLLAFSSASGWVQSDSSQSPASSSDVQVGEEEGDDSDQPIEEWMILGTEGQAGDSSIQLHLSYWNSSEEDSGEGEAPADPDCYILFYFALLSPFIMHASAHVFFCCV